MITQLFISLRYQKREIDFSHYLLFVIPNIVPKGVAGNYKKKIK